MSESFRSAVALRNDICTLVSDLQQRNTAPLPDAATVFVTGDSALYRLVKGLGDAFDALTGRIVIPGDGSDNRWVQEEVYGSSPWSGVEALLETNAIPVTGSSVWAALGTDPGTFALAAGDVDMFEVDPATSLMTYHGLPRFMMLTAVVTIASGLEDDTIFIVISKNDDVPAGSSSAEHLKGEQFSVVTTSDVNITTQRSAFMAPGDTLRLMVRSALGSQLFANRFTLSAMPL